MKKVILYANVNPLEPNCMLAVDSSEKHCMSVDGYTSTLLRENIEKLHSLGFKCEYSIIEESIIRTK